MTADPLTVVKIGGSTLGQHDTSLDDVATLFAEGRRFVVVHGGGATITEWLAIHNVESRFVRGLRVTDERALDVVVAVLAGVVNKRLVAELEARGAPAVGRSGADGAVIRARRYDPELGFVGQVVSVDGEALRAAARDAIVVLAPIAIEVEGQTPRPQLLNVNADTAAGEIAVGIGAQQLIFLTDVPGVMDGSGAVRSELSANQTRELLDNGVVAGGMIPKVEAALHAAASGVPAHIVDGRRAGALRDVIAGQQAAGGTRIV
ncbi:MAG: acetylglutamate kinase [Dehalococcoidia bacterium]